ncbi:hypothetical protein ACP3TJ_05225 [Desulforudis sp. 1088]|uniref:hypothetical protein n=3 Tax=Candidatus Desulforudis TaxID=471826 RepID=UPI003CE45EA9
MGTQEGKPRRGALGMLLDLLQFQVRHGLSQDDMLLFMSVYNTSLILEILERRIAAPKGRADAVPLRDPLAALGQLLSGRGKETESAGAGQQPAGPPNRQGANLQALLPALLTLLQTSPRPPGPAAKAGDQAEEGVENPAEDGQDDSPGREGIDLPGLMSAFSTLMQAFPPQAPPVKAPAQPQDEKEEKAAGLTGDPPEKKKRPKPKPEVLQWNFGRPSTQVNPALN